MRPNWVRIPIFIASCVDGYTMIPALSLNFILKNNQSNFNIVDFVRRNHSKDRAEEQR